MTDEAPETTLKTVARGALKSRTIWFTIALAIFGTVLAQFELLRPLFGEWGGLAFVLISVIVAVLRVITTTSLERK